MTCLTRNIMDNSPEFLLMTLAAIIAIGFGGIVKRHDEKDCEVTLVASRTPQTISTPHYPGNYENALDCAWTILSDSPGLQVEIDFSRIETEACCDYVTVHDGSSSDAGVVAVFRGNVSGCSYLSTFGAFHITFVSDDSLTAGGFLFRFAAVEILNDCGTHLTATLRMQTFNTPKWPLNYPNNSVCTWTITAPPGYQVYMSIRSFYLRMFCDVVQIRDGIDETSVILASLRGQISDYPSFLSTDRKLYVRFRADSTRSASGFTIIYQSKNETKISTSPQLPAMQADCGGELETPPVGFGVLRSPGFPNLHPGDLDCAWVITAPLSDRVRVWFNYINTQRCCDWIKIRDGTLMTSTKLSVISGYPLVFHSFVSSGNAIRIEFDTDGSINGRGFTGFYEAYNPGADSLESQCGGEYYADLALQYISTPNWPNPYDNGANCTWVIATFDLETHVRLHLLGTITENYFDTLTIYDGRTTLSPKLLRLAGKHHTQFIVTSTGPFMTVQFRADLTYNGGGFRASYTEVYGVKT